jgi:type IV secretory pathway ATPase VirB11/archaellum biosynthesis ATPase
MWIAVENGINTLFAGGTASGKTTTLNALSLFIPRESKIVSIEETRELNLPHPNWIPGVARSGFGEVVADKVVGQIDMYDLMKAALRQRPEYILVGEIRVHCVNVLSIFWLVRFVVVRLMFYSRRWLRVMLLIVLYMQIALRV